LVVSLTAEEGFKYFSSIFKMKLKDLTEEKHNELWEAYISIWNEKFGNGSPDFPSGELLIAVATR
jgi:hypothetical protein